MSSPTDRSIRRAASRLRVGVFVVMALVVALYLSALLDLRLAHARVEHQIEGLSATYGWAIGVGGILLLLVALFRLSQMLGRIAAGDLFSTAVIGQFRAFALWLLLMALFDLLAPIAAGVAGAASGYPHRLRIAVDLRDLLTVGITLLLFLLASLLDRARRLDEEVREFV